MIESLTSAAHGGHVDVTITFTSEEEWTALQYQIKLPSGDWPEDQATLYAATVDGEGTALLQFQNQSFRLRVRQFVPVGETWTAWTELSYTAEEALLTVEPPRSRWVSYKSVLDGVLVRRGHSDTSASASELADAAEMITSAYRHCLECTAWPELNVSRAVTCTNGLVTWAAVEGAEWVEFFTADPDAVPCTARSIHVKRTTQRGFHLHTTLEEVWAQFVARPPQFIHLPVQAGDDYDYGAIVYSAPHMYECMSVDGAAGNELTDPDKWRVMRILWTLADATKLLAVADHLGNSDHERAQAADLRGQAEDKLFELRRKNQPNH